MAKIISVVETKEGLSRFVLATNLAIALHVQSGQKTAALDLSFSGTRNFETLLDLPSSRSIADICPVISRFDTALLKGYLTTHSSGISVLTGTGSENKTMVTPEAIHAVIERLASLYPFIIIAAPGEHDHETLAAVLDESSIALVTASPDILSLRQLQAFNDIIKAWHFPAAMVKPVVARTSSAHGLDEENSRKMLEQDIFGVITEDRDVILSSINRGTPAITRYPHSEFSKDIKNLAKKLLDNSSFEGIDKSGRTAAPKADEKTAPAANAPAAYVQLKTRLLEYVSSHPELKNMDLNDLANHEKLQQAREKTRAVIQDALSKESNTLTREERAAFVDELLDETLGLGCLEKLLSDPETTEIMVNGINKIYIEKKGKIQLSGTSFTSNKQLRTVIDRIVSPIGRRIDESSPLVDARLADGSRVNAVIPPVALDGPSITIRKFSKKKLTTDDLVTFGAIRPAMADFLKICVRLRKNIVISGGTGSGKTTLLNIVSSFIPTDERIVTIEDSAELKLPQEHVVRLESRPASVEGTGEINIRRLVINALRMRPDRIVVGECRGGETLDMLQAMNTGHDGSLTTIHANSPKDGIARLTTMAIMAGMDLPERAIREQICSAVQVMVQLSRIADGSRKVTEIAEITGIKNDRVELLPLFVFEQTGIKDNKVIGSFAATGNIPTFFDEITTHGLSLDTEIFRKGELR
ncbi:MAG: hypothetical protein A2219_06250 [Elusimicrobia bacterium RIFOXYA2_FULL_50_26]|nr:MAG: hypothetical protein A2219_06250 [Elusimicrobia bacterium RIFOXYA2_FULL_50_26]